MKKIWLYNLLPLILLALASPVSAEFYRYQDQHGNMIFTDDLSKVPADQRSQATMYEESHTDQSVPSVQEGQAAGNSPEQQANEDEALKIEAQRLIKVKEKLDQEYNELSSDNAKLKAEQKEAVTPDQIKAVNKKVVNFNTQFQAYQEKSAAYEAEVKAYNERVSKAQAKPQPGSAGN
jgi:Zn-dependent M32 family carboxypeptidase